MGYAASLKAGDYELVESASPLQLLERITAGDVNQSEVRFIEGWTFSQLRRALDEHPAIQHDTVGLSDQKSPAIDWCKRNSSGRIVFS